MNLPNFLILGAQRSRTTWLWKCLRQHPEVFVADQKELEYFSYRHKDLSLEGMSKEHFAGVKGEKAIGEASPSYFWNSEDYPEWCDKPKGFNRHVPELVHTELGPDVKLIVILRDPVQRAVSALIHHIRMGRLNRWDNIFSVGRFHGIIHMGFYFSHLMKWLEHFERKQILVLFFEETIRNPQETIESVFRFLDVDASFLPEDLESAVNVGLTHVRKHGNVYLPRRDDPGKEVEDYKPEELERLVSKKDLEVLSHIYRKDVLMLSSLLEKDLSHWAPGQLAAEPGVGDSDVADVNQLIGFLDQEKRKSQRLQDRIDGLEKELNQARSHAEKAKATIEKLAREFELLKGRANQDSETIRRINQSRGWRAVSKINHILGRAKPWHVK